jgi:hypothetical protein
MRRTPFDGTVACADDLAMGRYGGNGNDLPARPHPVGAGA